MFFDVNQGKHFLKRKNVKEERNRMYEGFENQTHSDENDDSALIAQLDILEADFNQKRSDYASAYKTLMDKTQGYIASPENMNLSINKNINVNRTNDSVKIVPTRVGCYKTTSSVENDEYVGTFNDSGTRTMPDTTGTYISYDDCKAQAIKGNYKYFALQNYQAGDNAYCSFSNDLSKIQSLGATNNILIGSDGRKYGGGWANSVYSINTSIANDSTTGLTYQADLGTNVSSDTCKVRAADLGAGAYALRPESGTNANNSLCYVGNTISNATSPGYAYKIITAYEFVTRTSGGICTLLFNGQIGVWNTSEVNIFDTRASNRNNINTYLTIDPKTPVGNAECDIVLGGSINTDGIIASYGSNCPTKPSDAMIFGNNGSISCNKYCHGHDRGPWQGPSELPSEWKGSQCKSAGLYQNTSCDYVGWKPELPGILPCTCTRNDNYPYETRPMIGELWTEPYVPPPPIINPPTPPTGIGNWTSYIVNKILRGNRVTDNYVVLSEGADPAYGCPKQFSTNYKCGNGPDKTINLAAEAAGQNLHFDCSEEVKVCHQFTIYVGDNGNIQIMNNTTGAEVWSVNIGNSNAVTNPLYNAANSKFGRNFMVAGESLKINEFIGSPSGKYHVIMSNDSDSNQSGLKARYSVYNCNDTVGNDSTANVVYQINPADKSLVGKVGFVNAQGAVQEYPAEMIQPGTDYDMFGNYDSPGHDISSFTMDNISSDDCKTKCSATDNCAGFVFNNSDKTCLLKDSGMFPNGLRIADSNSSLYVRSKTVKGDVSCPKTMDKGISAYEWATMPVGEKMQMSTLCKLGLVTNEEQAELDQKEQAVNLSASALQDKINVLVENDTELVNKLGNRVNKLKKDLKQYKSIHKKIGKSEHMIEGLNGLSDDSELQMISHNYKYLLMTILAILLVGTVIKVSRR